MATLGDKSVGNIVKMNVNGTATEFIIVHQGLPSSMYDSSCNGTWLLMKSLIFQVYYFENSFTNEYSKSQLHIYSNNTFYNFISSDIRELIKTVKIPYINGPGDTGTLATGTNGLSTKIFSLSGEEVGLTHSWMDRGDGTVLDYFSSGGDSKRIAYTLNSKAETWLLRTPPPQNDKAAGVTNRGQFTSIFNEGASYTNYIRPALVFPPNVYVNDDGFIEKSSSLNGTVTIGGAQKELVGGYVNIGGTWKEIVKQYTNVGGVWKE